MDGQFTNAATVPYAPQQIPQQERQQAQPGSLPPGSLNFGAIKVLSIIMLVVVVFNVVFTYVYPWISADLLEVLDNSGMQLVLIARSFLNSLTPLLAIIIGFLGMVFSNKLRRHGIADKWLSGCSLADIIAGCTFLVSNIVSTVTSPLFTPINIEPDMRTSEEFFVTSTVSTILLIIRIIGVLAVVIILFIKAKAARQVIYGRDTLGIASAICLALNYLFLLINLYVILPVVIPSIVPDPMTHGYL